MADDTSSAPSGALTVAIATIEANQRVVIVDVPLLWARIPVDDHPTGRHNPRPIELARAGRLGVGDLNITHPQEAQALFVQSYGWQNHPACTRCARRRSEDLLTWSFDTVSPGVVSDRAYTGTAFLGMVQLGVLSIQCIRRKLLLRLGSALLLLLAFAEAPRLLPPPTLTTRWCQLGPWWCGRVVQGAAQPLVVLSGGVVPPLVILLRVVGLRPLLVSPLRVVGTHSYELSCLFTSLQRVVGQRN
ncbi:MAG: hypothetical protein FRX48_01293 [Lasallia pustulata]|uniref:Uncharacterized protein n=1 Tax=Lasallia pustulata TaxID=136370 RepID=A0A5M8Q0N9_9LECA|nr:MAG: hypothetical protein FRX48_01293 [Lasallia pustulata]